jgi:hypothetical protein
MNIITYFENQYFGKKSDEDCESHAPKQEFHTIIMSRNTSNVFSAIATKPLAEHIIKTEVADWPEN